MKTYRAALIGCSRMGAFIDNEVAHNRAYSHAAGYEACDRTDLIACSDLREDVLARTGERYGVPKARQYTDYRALINIEKPDIASVATQPEQRAEIAVYAAEQGGKGDLRGKSHGSVHVRCRCHGRCVRAQWGVFQLGHQSAVGSGIRPDESGDRQRAHRAVEVADHPPDGFAVQFRQPQF